jgi:hypothetical protein
MRMCPYAQLSVKCEGLRAAVVTQKSRVSMITTAAVLDIWSGQAHGWANMLRRALLAGPTLNRTSNLEQAVLLAHVLSSSLHRYVLVSDRFVDTISLVS